MRKSTALIITSYLLVYIVWGSTYFFIKLGVQTIPPFLVVGLRFFIGGLLFLLVCGLTGRLKRLPTVKELLSAMFMGTLLLMGGNALVTIAEKKVDSYLAALIISSTPLAIAVFNRLLFGIRLKPVVGIGIVLGLVGVAALLYDGRSFAPAFSPEILLLLAALTLWSFATCIGHRMPRHPDLFVNSGLQMFWVGLVCFAIQLVVSPAAFGALTGSSIASIFGVAYLATLGSLTFAAYTYLIMYEPAQRISSYALVNPPIAVLFGLLLGKETPVPFLMIGLPFSLAGIFLLLYGDTVVKKLRRQHSANGAPNNSIE
jgi:drug/metabolite transporter (DMT)-like permease